MDIHSDAYQKAFIRYLRKGTEIDLSFKAAEPNKGFYIWRTQGDDRVRASHAANEGKIFAWDKPPATGNPGEEPGCRCWAEASHRIGESVTQYFTTDVSDSNSEWNWPEFFWHYRFGEGKAVTLKDAGYVGRVTGYVERLVFSRVENQVVKNVRNTISGNFEDNFERTYSLYSISTVLGKSTISGRIQGNVYQEEEYLVFEATVDYEFYDEFTDILSQREHGRGTSRIDQASPEDLEATEYGTPYTISGEWSTAVIGKIFIDPERSRYQTPAHASD